MLRAHDRVAARLFRGGWAARLAYALGLQGRLAVRRHELSLPRRAGASPLRLVFASDFHAGPTTDPRLLHAACAAIRDARPDVVLLGGDFVVWHPSDVDALVEPLATIRAPLGVYAVLGNHDLAVGRDEVQRALTRIGVRFIMNRGVRLAPPHDDVCICGLDDPILGRPRPEDTLPEAPPADTATIVLMHAPDGLLAIGDRHFDFAFCGHTHGGQIALPWGRPIVVPRGRLSRRYSRGLYQLRHERRMLVSHGVGCSMLPIRVFARPEVHVCEIG